MNHVSLFRSTINTAAIAILLSTSTIVSAQSPVLYPKKYLQKKVSAGQQRSAAEVRRFTDLGRLWGVLHYFNPKVNSGTVVTDSIALQALRLMLTDASAKGFRNAVAQMLTTAGDPDSRLVEHTTSPSLLFSPENAAPKVFTPASDILFISFPPLSANQLEDPSSIHGLMPAQWTNAKGIVIDIRSSKTAEPYSEAGFIYDVMPQLLGALAGNKQLPAVFEKRIIHNGFVSQSSNAPNIYNSGFQTTAAGNYSGKGNNAPIGKPVAIIYNRYTDIEILKQLWVLRSAGLCKLIFEGAAGSEPRGSTERLMLTDDLAVQVRINEFQLSGNQALPSPDLFIDRITDTSMKGSFVQQAITLLTDKKEQTLKAPAAAADFIAPKPARYADTLVPSAELRLFGLYNFWNAIQYFSPYKHELDHSWDSVLHRYIPVFLNANDSLSYMLAIRALASETQDCHGFIGTIRAATPARKFYGAWPPIQMGYVRGKVYITEMVKDSSQDLSQIQPGDEVISIDGLSIKEQEAQWRAYIPTSNENTYQRDVANYLTVGPLNSATTISLRRGQRNFTVKLNRNGRWPLGRGFADFNKKHSTTELLPGNIGYINMGNLRPATVDSAMRAFAGTRAMIMDIRNYPQGTAWSIAPGLTDSVRTAVIFDKPFVDYNYLRGGEDKSTLKSAFTVMPSGKTPYKGKLIILCDRTTQSQAEYSIMMFQGAIKSTVIGNQTAGADGNVTEVTLPGGYSISFSGLGIYYPDGTPTQRRGIKIDIQAQPTIGGLMAGKDELLDRAVLFINTGK
ncbi:S41 family peptidase [Terrimonas sp. NA20]|uniref:S41 family peptidase n=1 Tax=Terrimonas ginsenosidimutans TaxID=2908004 RepID=A0ABS9KM53_9BACT|nr:S41 family peptidase [Terrimonas ginsenosidimutans]MCG2613365.1 S41 family peptidase [Terrimonas ginsenosidimutans]